MMTLWIIGMYPVYLLSQEEPRESKWVQLFSIVFWPVVATYVALRHFYDFMSS